jgi:hypothetical protein
VRRAAKMVASELYRRDTVTLYKTGNTKTLGVCFSALLTEGGDPRVQLHRA